MPRGYLRIRLNRDTVILLIARRKMKHRAIAKRVGVTPGHWSNILNGHKYLTSDVLAKIHTVFNNVAWDDLFRIAE